jgi:protein TonB
MGESRHCDTPTHNIDISDNTGFSLKTTSIMNYERLDQRSNGLVLTASLDNMLFEDKNRSYGAYQMRISETRRLMASAYFTAAIVLIITLILFFRLSQSGDPVMSNFIPVTSETFDAKIIDLPDPVEPETPQPAEPAAPNDPPPATADVLPTQAVLIPEPSPVAEDTSTMIAQAAIVNPGATNSPGGGTPTMGPEGTGPGTGTGTGDPGPIILDETNPDFWTAKQPAVLNLDDIKKSIVYPRQLKEAEFEGDVILKILVDEKGAYKSHKVLKSAHPLFLKEVESRIKPLSFTPGNQGGRNVQVWVTMPFKFRLNR